MDLGGNGPQCILDAGHNGYHRDEIGVDWAPRIANPPSGLVHCYDCGENKRPEDFQIGIRGKPSSPCLSCRAIRLREYVASGRRPKRTTPYATIKAWSQRNPEKKSAHNAVSHALKTGKIEKRPCELCGASNAQAHHADYSKKLDVKWLCYRCHKKEHRKYA